MKLLVLTIASRTECLSVYVGPANSWFAGILERPDLASLAVALNSCNTFLIIVYTEKEMFTLNEVLRLWGSSVVLYCKLHLCSRVHCEQWILPIPVALPHPWSPVDENQYDLILSRLQGSESLWMLFLPLIPLVFFFLLEYGVNMS